MPRHKDGELIYVCGKSRCGKSKWLIKRIRDKNKTPRLLIWDPKPEYKKRGVVTRSLSGKRLLAGALGYGEMPAGRARIAFVPTSDLKDQFDFFCRMALWWGQYSDRPTVVVCEEIADVTHWGKAPEAYGFLLRRGLGEGITIYTVTQAPAEAEKTSLRNHSLIHCGPLGREPDRKTMALQLDVPQSGIDALKVTDSYGEYLEKTADGKVKKGKILFKS